MSELSYQEALHDMAQRLSIGYTYQKLIINDYGLAEDFVFLDANPAFEKIFGLNSKPVIGKRATEVFHRIKKSSFNWVLFGQKAAENGKEQEVTRYIDTLNRWISVTTYSREDMHFAAFYQDTTPKFETSDELEHLQNLQAMFDEHTAVMLLTEPLTDKIMDANLAACDFYGYTRAELKSMCIDDISPSFKQELHRRHMKPNPDQDHKHLLFPHRLKNGEIRMVEIYSSPIHFRDKTQCYSIIFDVTNRERYRKELFHKKEMLSITLRSIGDGVVTTDKDGLITSLNTAAQEITGWDEQVVRNLDFSDIFHLKSEETGKTVDSPIREVLQTGNVIGLANHTVLIDKRGTAIPIADNAAPIRDERGNTFGVVMVFRDVRHDREHEEEVLYLSYHDFLTGLYNRRFVMEELKRLDAARQLPLSIIIGDVNGLKLTNDAFGHAEGDKLLQKAASILKECCREEDIVARWGGDEFLVLLPKTPAKAARSMIQRMKSSFIQNSEGMMQISVSMGYAVKETAQDTLKDVLNIAEQWMYHKKLTEGKSHRSMIINTLLATLYENSIGTDEHSKRLEGFCLNMGTQMNLSAEELNELSLLARLHDIGKIGIHHDILQKRGPLTADEWEEIRRHPEIGYRIVKNIPELSMVAEYILLHHERGMAKGTPKAAKKMRSRFYAAFWQSSMHTML